MHDIAQHQIAQHQIIFLDRDSLIANIRQPAFAHRWRDYPATSPDEVVDRRALGEHLVADTAQERFIHELGRLDVGGKRHEHPERHFERDA